MTSDLTASMYQDESEARAQLEAQRWPNGPVCPKCGTVDNATRLCGEKHRPGLLECRACRRQFSVTIGTVFERSHVLRHKSLKITVQELTGDWQGYATRGFNHTLIDGAKGQAPTQTLGAELHRKGFEGILTVSAKMPTRRNLVVFPDNLAARSFLRFDHPDPAQKPVIINGRGHRRPRVKR